MPIRPARHRPRGGGVALLAALVAIALAAPGAQAAPPQVGALWASEVSASTARLNAEINANGSPTTYHFDYITVAAYEANLAGGREGFAGAARVPPAGDANLGTSPVQLQLSNLSPQTDYRYRLVARNSDPASPTISTTQAFTTQSLGGGVLLADGRGWEMVSPVDKNGGRSAISRFRGPSSAPSLECPPASAGYRTPASASTPPGSGRSSTAVSPRPWTFRRERRCSISIPTTSRT